MAVELKMMMVGIWICGAAFGVIVGSLLVLRMARPRGQEHIDEYWEWREAEFLKKTKGIVGEDVRKGQVLYRWSSGKYYTTPEEEDDDVQPEA